MHGGTHTLFFDLLHGAGRQGQCCKWPLTCHPILVHGHKEFAVDVEAGEEDARAVAGDALGAGAALGPGQC